MMWLLFWYVLKFKLGSANEYDLNANS
jgi:hypothetical protein